MYSLWIIFYELASLNAPPKGEALIAI